MDTSLPLDGLILNALRTRKRPNVRIVTQAILERVGGDSTFAPLLDRYVYTTLHHYSTKSRILDWTTLPWTLLPELENEPRLAMYVQGSRPRVSLHIQLNCGSEIVKENVDGRRRNVPQGSESSLVGLSPTPASHFSDGGFVVSYVDLTADLFMIINGEYGYAEHSIARRVSDYDRLHRDPFKPAFITWANFFGPEWIEKLGRERLLTAPAHEVRELANGSILLTVAENPLHQLQPEVQERIAAVKAHLGILSPSERASPEQVAAFEARSAARQAEMHRRIEDAFRQAREQTASEMQRQAGGCVAGVAQFWHERLDYSPASLEVIARLIYTQFQGRTERETIDTAVQAFGAYVGEVVRRNLGGVWHDEEMKGQPVLLSVGARAQRVDPFREVRDRFAPSSKARQPMLTWYSTLGTGTEHG